MTSDIVKATFDLVIACDRSRSKEERAAAWDRYEVSQWHEAHRSGGLEFRNLDHSTRGLDGETMQDRVYRCMCADKMPPIPPSQAGASDCA